MGKKQGLPPEMQRAHKRAAQRSGGANPFVGDRRQLVVLAAFADRQFQETDPLLLWDKIFNQHAFGQDRFQGSVRDYFYDQSYGRFRLTFDLHQVTLADRCYKYRSTQHDDENSRYLVEDIVDSLQRRGGIDWSPYDWDADGYVDQLLIVYAGKGMNDGGDANSIWPHQWWLSEHIGGAAVSVGSGEAQRSVDRYCCVNELSGSSTYGTFGTICHEYSHCFGLPDFYYDRSSTVNHWDIMDMGNYNGGGFCPPGYSAHERMFMGWMDIPELTSPQQITGMQPLADSAQAYLIRNDAYPSEFYVVENRQQRGWDSSLPGAGVLVFHVDFDDAIWRGYSEYVNSNLRKRYTLFPANNISSTRLESNWAYPYQGNDSLTNYSQPSATLNHALADGSLLMSKPLYAISVDQEGRASFHFMQSETTALDVVRAADSHKRAADSHQRAAGGQSPDDEVCYDLRGQRVQSPSRGIYIMRCRKIVIK
jgi:M6 family metalloprotease-like protein